MAKIATQKRQMRHLAEFSAYYGTKIVGNQILSGKMVSHVKKFKAGPKLDQNILSYAMDPKIVDSENRAKSGTDLNFLAYDAIFSLKI